MRDRDYETGRDNKRFQDISSVQTGSEVVGDTHGGGVELPLSFQVDPASRLTSSQLFHTSFLIQQKARRRRRSTTPPLISTELL